MPTRARRGPIAERARTRAAPGKRLHEFLGPARLVGLYLAGALGGTVATQVPRRSGRGVDNNALRHRGTPLRL